MESGGGGGAAHGFCAAAFGWLTAMACGGGVDTLAGGAGEVRDNWVTKLALKPTSENYVAAVVAVVLAVAESVSAVTADFLQQHSGDQRLWPGPAGVGQQVCHV